MKKVNRRNFLQKSSLALASTGIISTTGSQPLVPDTASLFIHHVYFWLKNPDNKEEHARLLEGLQSLQKIKAIKTSHIGVPADTNRPVIDTSYQFSWLLIFNNRQDQDVYQTHPVHLKFVEEYSMLWEKVVVYDSVNIA